MKFIITVALAFLLTLLGSEKCFAQKKLFAGKDTVEDKSKGVIVFPILYYKPDTRLGFGPVAVKYFKMKSCATDTCRLSYINFISTYTLNKQSDLRLRYTIYTPSERFLLEGNIRYRNFPDKYYGIGNKTKPSDLETYEYDLTIFEQLVQRSLKQNRFLGLDFNLYRYTALKYSNEGILQNEEVSGTEGGLNIGVGLVYTIDKRENIFNSKEGSFFKISAYDYGKRFGGDFNYSAYNITYNRYKQVRDKCTFAWQVVGNFKTHNPPFISMSAAGGDRILRGYAQNRYRDNNFTGMQAEYRFPIHKKISGVTFAGLGDVYNQLEDLNIGYLKYSYGGGIRYSVNEEENVNIRLDYGFGRQNSGFYLSVGEAF